MNDFFEKNGRALSDFVRLSGAIGARPDYVQGGGGNTSVKLGGGLMAIKASGYALSDIQMQAGYAVLDYKSLADFYMNCRPGELDDIEKRGAQKAGDCAVQVSGLDPARPSVEAGFHSILPGFVIHSHSVYANLAACALEGEAVVQKALAGSGIPWTFVPYADPGAKLSFFIRDALGKARERFGERPGVIFMQNHGLIVAHDDPDACLGTHGEVNELVARQFGLSALSFPAVAVVQGGGVFVSDTPYLAERLGKERFTARFLLSEALYPDQLVFLSGTLTDGLPGDDQCAIGPDGIVVYRMPRKKALVIEQTLAAVVFIAEHIEKAGYTLLTMDPAARAFIENWESEKYRKSLASK